MGCGRIACGSTTRREMLRRSANGFGALALAALMGEQASGQALRDQQGAGAGSGPYHHAPRARNVIFLYMDGGPSQVDTFDPKPRLDREHGQPIPMKTPPTQFNNVGTVLQVALEVPPVRRERHTGERPVSARRPSMSTTWPSCGRWSRTFPSTRRPTTSCTRAPACRAGPAMGAWVTYGLGSECQNLPALWCSTAA